MREFNLQEALNGAVVVTRRGARVKHLHLFPEIGKHKKPLTGVMPSIGATRSWSAQGRFINEHRDHEYDLFMRDAAKTAIPKFGSSEDVAKNGMPVKTDVETKVPVDDILKNQKPLFSGAIQTTSVVPFLVEKGQDGQWVVIRKEDKRLIFKDTFINSMAFVNASMNGLIEWGRRT